MVVWVWLVSWWVHAEPLCSVTWIDSETGCAIPAEQLTVGVTQEDLADPNAPRVRNGSSSNLALSTGRHQLTVLSPSYHPWLGEVAVDANGPAAVRVLLDPIRPPQQLEPEQVRQLHRPDATLVLGYVVEEESAQPLAGAQVSSPGAGVAVQTDERGFFMIYLPVREGPNPDRDPPTTSLVFEKAPYRTVEYEHIELWANGDWTFRVRLSSQARGSRTTVDQRPTCRRHLTSQDAEPPDASSGQDLPPHSVALSAAEHSSSPLGPATATGMRLPRNIRVLDPDGVSVDYVSLETYCRHVLPQEWIASWAADPGGSNALSAGAVTIRTYAVGYINKPKAGTYDICATTACQVYGPATSTYSDAAVQATAAFLLTDSSGAIPVGLTEYSAENNSLGLPCTDGFGAPTSGCLYDPVCAGESRNGHGRGLCQWGSAKWATGLKFPSNSTRDHATLNGFPRRDWAWILQHYYPQLRLSQAAPLTIGDTVKATTSVRVRACAGGSILDGVTCPALATQSAGATGIVLAGPVQVTSDGSGYTWYQVQWPGVTGWSVENYLERALAVPNAPMDFSAKAQGDSDIVVSWSPDNLAAGFEIERAPGPVGPWTRIATVPGSELSFTNTNLFPDSTWSYRGRSLNGAGNSGYSAVTSARVPGLPPALAEIPDQIVPPGGSLRLRAEATAAESVELITDFESYASDSSNGGVVFREPRFSATTSGFLASAPDLAVVTDVFPSRTGLGERVLRVSCAFATKDHAWLRLTTADADTLPNPVIDLTRKLQLDVYSDKPVGIALGVRETGTVAGTPISSDGGVAGPTEWVGVSNSIAGQPAATHTAPAGVWTTFTFDFAAEPVRSFASGDGILLSPSGLGVLEHIAIVPLAGTGLYNIYLDNLAVLAPKTLAYSLEPGAPTGMSIDPTTGWLTWTPGEQENASTNLVSVRVTDSSSPPLSEVRTFRVVTSAQLRLQARVAGGQLTLSWAATAGVAYQVQFKQDLADPDWLSLQPPVIPAATQATQAFPFNGSQGFYRVQAISQ